MSRSNDDDGNNRTTATLQKIEQAILRVGAARQQLINEYQNGGIPPALRKEFHTAVINYYIELRPFRNHRDVKDEWTEAELWQENNETVTGLDNLLEWVDKTRQSTQSSPGRGNASNNSVQPDTLPPRKLLKISMLLDDIAHELGFSPDTRTPVADASEAVV